MCVCSFNKVLVMLLNCQFLFIEILYVLLSCVPDKSVIHLVLCSLFELLTIIALIAEFQQGELKGKKVKTLTWSYLELSM